jgi:hypothetical protein
MIWVLDLDLELAMTWNLKAFVIFHSQEELRSNKTRVSLEPVTTTKRPNCQPGMQFFSGGWFLISEATGAHTLQKYYFRLMLQVDLSKGFFILTKAGEKWQQSLLVMSL